MPKPVANGDAFIGIDIDVDLPTDTAGERRPRESSKRPSKPTSRATTCADAASKRPKKPKPPQNPPPSLISLLQKDASVRSYFQSLQENLDYDVEKWKHEAAMWKRLASTSTTVSTKTPPPSTVSTRRRRTEVAKKQAALDYKGESEKKARTSSQKYERPKKMSEVDFLGEDEDAIPITDEVLFGDLSDDDSSESSSYNRTSDNFRNDDASESNRIGQRLDTMSNINSDPQRRRRSHNILENLKLAKKKLDLLGISLVEVEVKTTTSTLLPLTDKADVRIHQSTNSSGAEDTDKNIHNTCDDGTTDNSQSITKTERILHRQSDEKVAADMMASLRTLIKTSSFIGSGSRIGKSGEADHGDPPSDDDSFDLDPGTSQEERMHKIRLRHYYHPFCRGGVLHLPNVYYSKHLASNEAVALDEENSKFPEHPAAIGLKHLVDVLILMDTYCGDDLSDDDWRAVFSEDGDEYTPTVGDDEFLQEDMTILKVGMRNRYRLTKRIVSSLDVEITRTWALTDRATNLTTSSVHFHPADTLDVNDPGNENTHDNFFGAKNFSRLVILEERVAHARIATLLHRRRGNLQMAAELVVGYIMATAPSLGAEHYPKLPPLLSLCVLEALLSPENYIPEHFSGADIDLTRNQNPSALQGVWFRACLHDVFPTRSWSDSILLKALAYPVHTAARLWRDRQSCADDRIKDIATVELAAFERIKRLYDGNWLSGPTTETMTIEHMTKFGILSPPLKPLDEVYNIGEFDSSELRVVSVISITLVLLTLGEVEEVLRLAEAIMSGMQKYRLGETRALAYLFLLPGCCVAYFNIMCRRWESMKIGNTSGRQTAAAFTIEDKLAPILDSVLQYARPDDWKAIEILVQCCVLLGDGFRLLKLAKRVVPTITHAFMAQKTNAVSITERKLISNTFMALIDAGEVPTVRVINLKRRPDRKLDFITCAVNKEQVIVIQGPSKLGRYYQVAAKSNPKTSYLSSDHKEDDDLGHYALDGQCSRDDLEKQFRQRLNGKGTLADFVNAQWRPSDLKAFDENARGDFELVHTSMTEKACALSHIAR